ncbi:unnamed protein product [Pseudo-nitzschia multistriata]|uniref:Uncharacterized protein n=1 Tax=Pseudo-nitzschia multistriata TaxID=183589 RepID=A0A448Z2R4_9STRA|nr:unnamed protein product [Pseudo-nitzschia multistriata]
MATIRDGFITEVDDNGVGLIPAPPSPHKSTHTNPSLATSTCNSGAMASSGSSIPSRDSVSAAIALVRAKQIAKSVAQRAEDQILQPRSFASDQTSTSLVTDSSSKSKTTNSYASARGENSAPPSLPSGEKSVSSSARGSMSISLQLPRDQSSLGVPSTSTTTSCDGIPVAPSLCSNGSDDFDVAVDAKTLDDVNAFLNRLGVGELRSMSVDSNNSNAINAVDSIENLRAASADSLVDEDKVSSGEIDQETLAEISAYIDAATKKSEKREEINEQESPIYERLEDVQSCNDPPSMFHTGISGHKDDPPAASPQAEAVYTEQSEKVNPFLDLSYREEEPHKNSQATLVNSIVAEEEATQEGTEEEANDDKSRESHYTETSFAASMRNTLSTVEEVFSAEAEEEEENEVEFSAPEKEVNQMREFALPAVASYEQESVYGPDGRKEPKGTYEKTGVEVEKLPVSNVGVEQNMMNSDMSVISTDSQNVGKSSQNVGIDDGANSVKSQGLSETDSVPWALRDVASEETMRATGRRRPRFVVSGPRPSNKSRNVASLFDDTSIQASEAASEFKNGESFVSEVRSDDSDEKSYEEEDIDDDEEENAVQTSDSFEGNGCLVDNILYNDYVPEDDYALQRGTSDGIFSSTDETEASGISDRVRLNSTESGEAGISEQESIEVVDDKYGVCDDEVGDPTSSQVEDEEDREIAQDPSGEMAGFVSSPIKASNVATATDTETNAKAGEHEGKIEQNNSFLRQFEDLDLSEEGETDQSLEPDNSLDHQNHEIVEDDVPDAMSPAALISYFYTIDARIFKGEEDEKLVKGFKRLMMPVIDGKKPTIIEEAQIRQAALKADIPLAFVDAFIDHVKDDHPDVAPKKSEEDDPDLLSIGWDDIEEVNEDEAIAAFLSSKFGANAEVENTKARKKHKHDKKSKELMGTGSRDYDPDDDIVTSAIEPDFMKTKSEDETNYEYNESETIDSDDSKGSTHESKENTIGNAEQIAIECPDTIPKVVQAIKKQEIEPVDMKILEACKSIESFDEEVWQRRTAMATYGWEWQEATWLSSPGGSNLSGVGIDGVAIGKGVSNLLFTKKAFPLARKTCKIPYKRRVKPHAGYSDIDVLSLQESAVNGEKNVLKDETPWELRNVRQRFLHERSLTFSRNWFGTLVKTSGNDRIKAPVCKPKSMEMPMRNIPDPGDWTPEWYTSWGGTLGSGSDSEYDSDGESTYTKDTRDGKDDSIRSYSTSSSFSEDEEWEDAPECGTIVNTKLKIGEHVSRVHPDYTSSLRKSRWRKKYFPVGTFPY